MPYYFLPEDDLLPPGGQPSSRNGQQKNLHPAPVQQQLLLMSVMAFWHGQKSFRYPHYWR
jgi:hypothetical protein